MANQGGNRTSKGSFMLQKTAHVAYRTENSQTKTMTLSKINLVAAMEYYDFLLPGPLNNKYYSD